MLSADKATGPYSQYEVDQSEKHSVSSSSSSSVSFNNVAASEKLPYTGRQTNQEENLKVQQKRPKRNSFRRIFGQNEKEEKEEKKVKEKKTRTLSIFSKDKSGKSDKDEKHERHENERLRPTPNHSNSGEKRKNRLSYIFFSEEEVKKDDLTLKKDDVMPKKRSSSNGSFSLSDDEDELEKSKNKPNTNRFSLNIDKLFGSEDDHRKNLGTNHNNLSDLFIPGNETPFKSHNRSRLINSKNLVESPTSVQRPISLVSSNTTVSDNTDDTGSKENERYQVDNNSITNDDSNHHEDTVTSGDHENNQSTQIIFNLSVHQDDIEIVTDDISYQNDTEVTNEHRQDYEIVNDSTNRDHTEIINEEISHQNDAGITDVSVNANNQDYSGITDDAEIANEDINHQDDTEITEIRQDDTEIAESRQDYTEITESRQDDTEITESRQVDTETEIAENRQIDTEVTNHDHDYVKITKGDTHPGYTEISNVNAGHQDYTNQISIKVTSEDVESNGEEDQKIRDDTDDIHIHDNHLASPNHRDGYEYSTLSSPASPTSSSFSPIHSDIGNEEEERGIRVIEKNRFHEVRKIVERYQVPKIIEKHVIVSKEDPQTRQKLEQLQATNENLISVNTQLESKIEEQSQQIAKLSSLESVMVRQVQLVERMEETIRRLETQVQDQKEELDVRISGHMEDTVRQLECKLSEKSKELDNLRTVVMDQLQPQIPPLYSIPVQLVRTIDTNGLLLTSEESSTDTTDTTVATSMAMTMTTRQESQEIYSKNTLVNTLVVKPLVNTIVVSAGIATSVLYAVYIRPVIGLVKVVRSRV